MTYVQIQALPPEAYLDHRNFVTALDAAPGPEYAERQYQHGLNYGKDGGTLAISARGVWSARTPNGHVQSYEGIGYHSCTAELLRGFLDSGCPILVYRWGESGAMTEHWIRGSAEGGG